jgi:hypothetical protein
MILNWFLMATMFLVLPALWVTALTWAGLSAGSFLRGLSEGTAPARSAGGTGTDVAMSAIKK